MEEQFRDLRLQETKSWLPSSNDGYASDSYRMRRLAAYGDKASLRKEIRPASIPMRFGSSRSRDALGESEDSLLIRIRRLIVIRHVQGAAAAQNSSQLTGEAELFIGQAIVESE